MARLFGILGIVLTLAACSSGVSNSGAGAAGTSCANGELNLVCTAVLDPNNESIDVFIDVDEEGEPTSDAAPATDTADLSIRLADPLGEFSKTFQGVTFETYDVSFESGQGGAPSLGTRRFTQTFSLELTDGTAEGTVEIPLVDQVTKTEFAEQASGSTVYPYVVTVRATGRDFATNSLIVVTARANIEIGNFVDSSGGGGGDG